MKKTLVPILFSNKSLEMKWSTFQKASKSKNTCMFPKFFALIFFFEQQSSCCRPWPNISSSEHRLKIKPAITRSARKWAHHKNKALRYTSRSQPEFLYQGSNRSTLASTCQETTFLTEICISPIDSLTPSAPGDLA